MKDKEMLYIKQNGECYIDKDCKWKDCKWKKRNDKEKQIEEIARLIKLPIESWLEDTEAIPPATTYYAELMGCINDSAEVLFNENYRKRHEDSVEITKEELKKIIQEEYQNALKDKVVLTKEEYSQLVNTKKFFDTTDTPIRVGNLLAYLEEFKEEVSKETAKELLIKQYQECIRTEKLVLKTHKNKDYLYYDGYLTAIADLKMYIVELTKQLGIEVG